MSYEAYKPSLEQAKTNGHDMYIGKYFDYCKTCYPQVGIGGAANWVKCTNTIEGAAWIEEQHRAKKAIACLLAVGGPYLDKIGRI